MFHLEWHLKFGRHGLPTVVLKFFTENSHYRQPWNIQYFQAELDCVNLKFGHNSILDFKHDAPLAISKFSSVVMYQRQTLKFLDWSKGLCCGGRVELPIWTKIRHHDVHLAITMYQVQSHSWGRYIVLVDVVLWAQEWALFLIFSAGNFFCTVCILWFVLWSLCWLKFNFIHPHQKKEWKENWDVRLVDLLLFFVNFSQKKKKKNLLFCMFLVVKFSNLSECVT